MSQGKDIEMLDATAPEATVEQAAGSEIQEVTVAQEIELNFAFLHKGAANFDNRYVTKVFRDLGALRRKLVKDPSPLAVAINKTFGADAAMSTRLLAFLPEDVVAAAKSTTETNPDSADASLPEIVAYLHLLVQLYLLDTNALLQLSELSAIIVALLKSYNRRSLDSIQAKLWFYVARSAELHKDLISILPELLPALRTATLRHDDQTTASIITLLLRNYLKSHDISQAANLCEKIVFPVNAGVALAARYYYYMSCISAIQLDYSTAHEYVITAIRKAPQTKWARGFVQEATKLKIIIELLMGDIPELKVFSATNGGLEPYFQVCKAVRLGDIKLFEEVLSKYEQSFVKDNNFTLVSRLRQNVIRTGIRTISLAYSKISLKDICIKLQLESEESTEYIVSKAIRDGVIEATVNHELGYMKSKELRDVYSTKLPQEDFDQRIRFCLSLHTDLVKAMRYPSNNSKNENKSNIESFEDKLGLLQALEEGDLDDFMD